MTAARSAAGSDLAGAGANAGDRSANGEHYPPVLSGDGRDDYSRYMRTDLLLSLQRDSGEMLHRDELLFQVVHQSTELWLKLACFEADQAAVEVVEGRLATACLLLERSAFAVQLVTTQLEMLSRIAPADFQRLRPALGNGSGFESPGWQGVRTTASRLRAAFETALDRHGESLLEVYRGDPTCAIYGLCEALIEWDERISLWRARHYKVAVRTLGHGTVGTKGLPTNQLAALLDHKAFPDLWATRTELTMGARNPAGD